MAVAAPVMKNVLLKPGGEFAYKAYVGGPTQGKSCKQEGHSRLLWIEYSVSNGYPGGSGAPEI